MNDRIQKISSLLYSLPSKPILRNIIFGRKMHPTVKRIFDYVLTLPDQELWLCDTNLWIYHGDYNPSWGWEKDYDDIFYRVSFGGFYIQWWDFPHLSYPEIEHLTNWFYENYNK